MGDERVAGQVIDGHSHIGEMAAWKFYDLKEAVKPTVYEFATPKDYIRHLDAYGCERGLVLPNYGIPRQEQPFLLTRSCWTQSSPRTAFTGACGCRSFRRTPR